MARYGSHPPLKVTSIGVTWNFATNPSGTICLAGWSAGAPIAVELAHCLRRLGCEVSLLVAIDGAPELQAGLRAWDPRYARLLLANLPRWWRYCRKTIPGFPWSNLRRLIRAGWTAAQGRLRAPPAVPHRLEAFLGDTFAQYPRDQQLFMARLYRAILQRRPPAWDGPTVVYEARVSPLLGPPQYLAKWRCVAPGAELAIVPGAHHTMMRSPYVAALAADLKTRIAIAASSPRARPGPGWSSDQAAQA